MRSRLDGWRRAVVTFAVVTSACASTPGPRSQPTASAPEPTDGPAATTTTTTPLAAPVTTTVVTALPLGDGRRSSVPDVGSVLSCQRTFGPAAGAFRDGPWIHGDTWDPTAKLHVQGSVAWAQAEYDVQVAEPRRVVTTNGVPGQTTTGVFPIAPDDPAYEYDRNPNTITPRRLTFTLPVEPVAAGVPECVGMGAIGVLADGVVLFNALDANGRDAAAHEVLDSCDGHPERTGQYHHHTVPSCMLAGMTARSTLAGYALDGFGIYVERHPDGTLLTNVELDECHGRTSPVLWDGRTVEMYHYVATLEYPYTVGCYRGTPGSRS